MNKVCFQCVGCDCGPVLKLVTSGSSFAFPLTGPPDTARFIEGLRPPSGHTSARSGSPSRATCARVSGGMGAPSGAKNVSKYSTNAWILVLRSVVETSLNDEEKSSWRVAISLI